MTAPAAREGYKFVGWKRIADKVYTTEVDGQKYTVEVPSFKALYESK